MSAIGGYKTRQKLFFDAPHEAEFETVRPHGSPTLYKRLIEEKFQRSLLGLRGDLPGATVLTVCGGSGMDAEFLARAGARVICSDLSLGAAARAGARAELFGLRILPIVADVESLPFRDRSIDLVYVHDGLHHLEAPLVGLREMARVARRAISVTEPARAAITAGAVLLGLALTREEAGNRVMRLTPADIENELVNAGFEIQASQRYAMYYRHVPGRIFERLSRPRLLPAVMLGWRAANAIIGRWGNKLAVTGVRKPA